MTRSRNEIARGDSPTNNISNSNENVKSNRNGYNDDSSYQGIGGYKNK